MIKALLARIETLVARVAELEAQLGSPPKTPGNSSIPPSKGQKRSGSAPSKAKAKPHAGAHRPLHPDPTRKRDILAQACNGCGADLAGVAQSPCEVYDRIEIPKIIPDVTRVALHGGFVRAAPVASRRRRDQGWGRRYCRSR